MSTQQQQISMVIAAAPYFPRIARGHGNRHAAKPDKPACVADGCVRFDKKKGGLIYGREHIQGELEQSFEFFRDRGFRFDPAALKVLKRLLAE